MIALGAHTRVFAYCQPCDLRKGYNGLSAIAEQALGRDILDGEVFVFVNRRRSSCKVLHHDGSGLCIYMKRLDKGRFAPLWRADTDGASIHLTSSELALFLEGCIEVGYRRLSPRQTKDLPAK